MGRAGNPAQPASSCSNGSATLHATANSLYRISSLTMAQSHRRAYLTCVAKIGTLATSDGQRLSAGDRRQRSEHCSKVSESHGNRQKWLRKPFLAVFCAFRCLDSQEPSKMACKPLLTILPAQISEKGAFWPLFKALSRFFAKNCVQSLAGAFFAGVLLDPVWLWHQSMKQLVFMSMPHSQHGSLADNVQETRVGRSR